MVSEREWIIEALREMRRRKEEKIREKYKKRIVRNKWHSLSQLRVYNCSYCRITACVSLWTIRNNGNKIVCECGKEMNLVLVPQLRFIIS